MRLTYPEPTSTINKLELSPVVGIAALLTAALGHAPLGAQEPTTDLTGCYDIKVGDWLAPERVPGQPAHPPPDETADSATFEIPPRIQFAGVFRDFYGRLTSRTRIMVPEGALPSEHGFMSGALVGDSLLLGFNDGFAGVWGKLAPSGNGWAGIVSTHIDTSIRSNRRPVELTPVSCDSPPPVSIDAMRPLTRSVELEGGAVIDLGSPLPESLEMAPGRFSDFRVVGRTTGLFGTTDAISVLMGWDQEVVSIALTYPEDEYEILASGFRDVFGSSRGAWLPSLHWRNRITYLDLSPNRVGTRVRLGDSRLRTQKGPLARSVELEHGAAISLREPLPASLETAPRQPGLPVTVVGRTAGLFGGADSISVGVNEEGTVRVVELFYRDGDDYASLQARLEGVYGDPHLPRTDSIPPGNAYINPITEIRLTRWRASGAHIRLSDHRYR